MKHRADKYPTSYGPDDNLPTYGITKTIRLSVTKGGRTHLTAAYDESSRRERQTAEESTASTTASPMLTEVVPANTPARRTPNPVANRAKVAANYAISGERNSPFENIAPKRHLSEHAKAVRRTVGAIAAAAVGIAGISTATVFGVRAFESYEATQARINTEQQHNLGEVVQPTLNRVGNYVVTAFDNWQRQHPGDTNAYTKTALPGNRVEITANDSSNQVIMGTKMVDGKRVPDPAQTDYAYVETVGDGTIEDQYYLADPAGTQYIPPGIPQASLGGEDYYEGYSGPGFEGVMSIEDTTVPNDAVLGDEFGSPVGVAEDINQNQGLNQILDDWQQDPQLVNSNINPQ